MLAPRSTPALGAAVAFALALAVACGDPEGAPGGAPKDAGANDTGAVDAPPADGRLQDAGPLACRVARTSPPPACGTPTARSTVIAGPGAPAHDATLAAEARRFDRAFHAINAHGVDVNAGVSIEDAAHRALVETFIRDSDGWDASAGTGRPVTELVTRFEKVAGLYAGVGVAADAWRYAVLRDEGAECAEVERARQHLALDLDALHLAVAITGTPGVIARGFARRSLPGAGEAATEPLEDASGAPYPAEKTNGTWREDVSGEYPDQIWEDSCSRDMLVGWVLGFAAAWEAIRDDDTFAASARDRLRADARALADSLRVVRESGYDLEIWDADGRRTYHGILHHESIDRAYLAGVKNGFNALMALGIVGALAWIADDPGLDAWLADDLVATRRLHEMARDEMLGVDLGVDSNFSSYNMAFTAGLLATRYLCLDDARDVAREAVSGALYARPERDRQPAEQRQTFFDLVHVAAGLGETAWAPPVGAPDDAALARGLETLHEWSPAPAWDTARENCDTAEIAALACVGLDGTPLPLLAEPGRGGALVAAVPVPMRIRPPSNYTWRTNPYQPNGGGSGAGLLPSNDYRGAYWLGRRLGR
ncbi:MAG: hypothetical protein IT376_17015 [Polyangiaceae bacterium]|nr:hypothetical protein [Polyangiaceae bacterium]